MKLTKNDTCAFDECSVLHLCSVEVPKAYQFICGGKEKIYFKNFKKLNLVLQKINNLGCFPFRFKPDDWLNNNLTNALNMLLENNSLNIRMMNDVFRREILESINSFRLSLESKFKFIEKSEDCLEIINFFESNEKELIKEKNIPEEDDCKILAGYINFSSQGNKFLISEDEHFWGYKDLILEYYSINVVDELGCHELL